MILGIDPGARRVGVAVADLETRFARPVEVIDAKDTDVAARVSQLVTELGVERIVVGRPVGLSGNAGAAVDRQQELLAALRGACDVEIVEYDERLTTVMADRALRAAGRSTRQTRTIKDAVAAQILLQGYLDATR
ncbi:MAG TPA: Holliday junction resolvase RuvX [Actinomycetota bacterium]|nr:Holliday junction resolvase RuvX [Actinomycetota bacterium]